MPVNLFDANFYRAANYDLRDLNDAQALSHFQKYGLDQGLRFSPIVDLNFYRASNSDLSSFSNKQAFEHLEKYGVAEGRRFSSLFDINFYVADNLDVAQAYGGSKEGAFNHFQSYGLSEGRKFSLTFDVNYYRSANYDLAATTLSNKELLDHFALFGENEGRASAETFNGKFYLSNGNSFINRVLELTNAQRLQAGLQPLTLNSKLNSSAQAHSEDMALHDFFDHKGSNGSSMSDRAKAAGYQFSRLAENIAAGYATPEDVVQGWMNSAGHRANILNPSYREMGIGYYYLGNDTGNVNENFYWTQDFGVIST